MIGFGWHVENRTYIIEFSRAIGRNSLPCHLLSVRMLAPFCRGKLYVLWTLQTLCGTGGYFSESENDSRRQKFYWSVESSSRSQGFLKRSANLEHAGAMQILKCFRRGAKQSFALSVLLCYLSYHFSLLCNFSTNSKNC